MIAPVREEGCGGGTESLVGPPLGALSEFSFQHELPIQGGLPGVLSALIKSRRSRSGSFERRKFLKAGPAFSFSAEKKTTCLMTYNYICTLIIATAF